MSTVTVAIEGIADEPLVDKILRAAGHRLGLVYGKNGKQALDKNLSGFNAAAQRQPWLVLRDLDQDALCAGELVKQLLPRSSPNMRFRIAVRESEAWLLGDRDRLASFLRISADLVPADPEALSDPKQHLVNLARRSRSREIRNGMVPEAGVSGAVGIAYTEFILEFIMKKWRAREAAKVCPSLSRCIRSLRSLR